MIFTCMNPGCSNTFRRSVVRGDRSLHCSVACRLVASRRIKPDELRALALTGATMQRMAGVLGANRHTVRKWLKADGLLVTWSRARYKKCAQIPLIDSRPRWRWDWKCNWWWRRTEGTFQTLMAPHWSINTRLQ